MFVVLFYNLSCTFINIISARGFVFRNYGICPTADSGGKYPQVFLSSCSVLTFQEFYMISELVQIYRQKLGSFNDSL
jgi:hypothetical protein